MVRVNFEDFDEHYEAIRISACGHQACSVLIMVALEVDAMASARMLSQLLRGDNVAYLIRPVGNFAEVEASFASNITSDIKTVFMINCGAIYDIPKAFGLEQGGDIRVFILDNHRPVHLKNIYSRHNVVVFDDNYDANNLQDQDDVPSEASEMSSVKDDDDDSLESKSTHSDEEEEEEEEEEEFEEGDQAEEEQEHEEEFEMDVDQTKDDDEAEDEETDKQEEDKADEDSAATKAKDLPQQPQSPGQVEGEEADQTFIGGWTGDGQPSSPLAAEAEGDNDITVDFDADQVNEDEADEDVMMNDEQEIEEEEEEEIKITSKKRKLLSTHTDPNKAKRQRIKAYYFQPVTYSSPTSLMLLKHVQQRFAANGQMPLDVSWQTILGVTDMFMKGRLNEQQYEECCHHLKIQLGDRLHSFDRLSYTSSLTIAASTAADVGAELQPAAPTTITINGAQTGQIQETSEYRFFLHRHWSLYESMFHSVYIASRFPVWNTRGVNKLQELLAEMGIPLQQCKQAYQYMAPELRQHFRETINSTSIQEKYGLKDTTVMYKSFVRYAGYKSPLAAEDVVQSTTALLELYSNKMVSEDVLVNHLMGDGGKENVPPPQAVASYYAHHSGKEEKNTFFSAYELLGGRNDKLIKEGISIALDIQRAIVKKASAMLDGQDTQIVPYHRIYYAYLRNNLSGKMNENRGNYAGKANEMEMELIFGRPMVLTRLGQFIMEVKRKLPKREDGWTGSKLLPLILLSERQDGSYLAVGISPLSTSMGVEGISEEMQEKLAPLVNFRQFFKLAAKDMNIKFRSNSFDPNVVEIDKEDTQDFLGALNNVLRKATPNFHSR